MIVDLLKSIKINRPYLSGNNACVFLRARACVYTSKKNLWCDLTKIDDKNKIDLERSLTVSISFKRDRSERRCYATKAKSKLRFPF